VYQTLDFIFTSNIGKHIDINLNARNILDPKITRLRENTPIGNVVLSEFRLGATVSLGLNYKF
jgi:outer membrane insertion C-terminal signal